MKNKIIKILSAILSILFLYSSVGLPEPVSYLRPQPILEKWNKVVAARFIKDWDSLNLDQEQQCLALLNERTTPQKVNDNIKARQSKPLAIPTGEEVVGVSLPDDKTEVVNLSGTAPNKDEVTKYIMGGATKTALERLGIVIAAGGEGTRLMVKLCEEGRITDEEKGFLTKFTMPFAPDGIGSLQQDLLVISFICKKFDVNIPILLVANVETEDRMKKLLLKNDLFGLSEIGLGVQDMEATLVAGDDKIAVDENGIVAFNPNGTGGVMKVLNKEILVLKKERREDGTEEIKETKKRGFEWFEESFNQKGLDDGKIVSLNSDKEIIPEQLFALAVAVQDHDAVAVSYPYPKDDIDPNTKEHLRNKYGTFVKVTTKDSTGEQHIRTTIIEYADRPNYLNLVKLIKKRESQSEGYVQANAGLLVFSLGLLKNNLEKIPQRIQKEKDSLGVKGKVDKPEYFVTDLLCYATKPLIVAMDEAILRPMKDWKRLRSKRAERIKDAVEMLEKIGFEIEGEPVVQLSVPFAYALRQDNVTPPAVAKIKGKIGVKFDIDGIKIYTLRQRVRRQEGKEGDDFLVFNELIETISYAKGTDLQSDKFILPSLYIKEPPSQPTGRTFGTVFNWGLLNSPVLWTNTSNWLELFTDRDRAYEFLSQYYGADGSLLEDRRKALISQLNFFVERFGHQDVAIFRAPGRVMFIGQHTDRPGAMGDVNRYAVKGKEIFIIAKRNNDSKVTIACPESPLLTQDQIRDFNVTFDLRRDLYEAYPQLLADNFTELSGAADSWDVIAKKIETDLNAITSKSPRHFLSGAAFLINNHFRKKTNSTEPVITTGIDFVIEGNIPPGIGISSSSATVISTAMALCAANGVEVVEVNADPFRKQITFKELCDLIGYGEWIVGTRGGTGDHAVIIFGHEGGIISVGVDHREVLDLPKGMTMALMNTPPRDYDEMKKTTTPEAAEKADQITVNRVISYNLALVFLKEFGGEKFKGIKNLIEIFDRDRDISEVEVLEAFKKVPDLVSREDLQAVPGISPEGAAAIRNIIQDKPLKGLAEGPWRPRAVGLSMVADLKRSSVVFPTVLKDTTMPDEQKRDLLFQMAETSMIGQRMEDNYGSGDPRNIAPWKKELTDADLDMAIQGIRQGQNNPYNNKPWSLINLTGLESYGVASWHQSMLHKYIKDRLAQEGLDSSKFTGFMQGAGLGGGILAVMDPSIKDNIMRYYEEYAEANFPRYKLWLDVPAGRGAEALVYPVVKKPALGIVPAMPAAQVSPADMKEDTLGIDTYI